MPRLTAIDVFPWSGFVDSPWEDTPHQDAFVRSARRVCESFNRELRDTQITAPLSSIRVFTHQRTVGDRPPPDDAALVSVLANRAEGFEVANVHVPTLFSNFTPAQRARVVNDVLAGILLRLGDVRDLDRPQLEQVCTRVLKNGPAYRETAPWKSSPDRRHRARCVIDIPDDGVGRLTVEVHPHSGEGSTSWGPFPTVSTHEAFSRLAKTLRWTTPTTLTVEPRARHRTSETKVLGIDIRTPTGQAEEPIPQHFSQRAPLAIITTARTYDAAGQMRSS